MTTAPDNRLVTLANRLRSGELPLLIYIDRLEAYFDAREPAVLSFIPEPQRFERLRREAQALLARYPRPHTRPPLFGVPVGVKDIFHVAGFVTRAGTRLPADILQGPQAQAVTALRQAAALVLGKTVTTEFAYFAPGPTRNPHNPAHTPGGSSSGSAAAVGATLIPLALGTQTIGSITRPAAYCGVVGYKPSYERIARAGVIPLSPSVDHIGFFTANVAAAALAAQVLITGWAAAQLSQRLPVLGTPEGPYLARASDEGLAHFRAGCQRLAAAGYTIKPVDAMLDYDAIYARHNQIVAAEAAQVHAEWFAQHSDLYHHKTAKLIERGQRIAPADLQTVLSGRALLRADLAALMDTHSIDLWLSPAAPGAAPRGLDSTGDPVMNLPWTHAGLPTLNLPAATNDAGLPLGLQVAARWQADEQLLAWGAGLETALLLTALPPQPDI